MRVQVQPFIKGNISAFVASFGVDTADLLMFDYCQSLGEVYTGFIDGEFCCCWGLIPPSWLSQQAYLWMWAPEPIRHQFLFIRHSQIQVQRMLERFDTIVGHTKTTSRSAQKWLHWLGAEFHPYTKDILSFEIKRSANG